MLPAKQIFLNFIKYERNDDDHNADHDQADERSCVVAEIGIIFDVVAQSALRSDHLSRGQQDKRNRQSLIAADEDLRQRRRQNHGKQQRDLRLQRRKVCI